LYDLTTWQDEKIAAVVAAVQKLTQVAVCFIFKHDKKAASLHPYGVAVVSAKQVVVQDKGGVTFA